MIKNHSIQYSIQKQDQIIHSKNLFIQKKSQIIHSNKIFIQNITQGYGGPLPKNSLFSPKNTVLGQIFTQSIHFSYEYRIFSFIQ